MEKISHINLSGFPGAGKTTIARLLIATYSNTLIIPKITTRKPREDEKNEGLEYVFVTRQKFLFQKRKGLFAEVKTNKENGKNEYYAIPKPEYFESLDSASLVISLFGSQAPTIRDRFYPRMKTIFISFKNKEILIERLRERCLRDGSDFESRCEKIEVYLASDLESRYDFVVYNDNAPEECLAQIVKIIEADI